MQILNYRMFNPEQHTAAAMKRSYFWITDRFQQSTMDMIL